MAITIRNKATETMIRQIGARTGEGPSAVIRRLAEQAVDKPGGTAPQAEIDARMAAWEELMKLAPPRDPNVTWTDIEAEMESLFDYLEEDQSSVP